LLLKRIAFFIQAVYDPDIIITAAEDEASLALLIYYDNNIDH
jgi:hypothetical protein